MKRVALSPHAATPCAAVRDITVEVRADADGLSLRYVVMGTIAALRVPPLGPPERADGLWRRTCLEAFVRDGDGSGYREFNFSPSRAWAAYAFNSYRGDMRDAAIAMAPEIEIERGEDRLALHAKLGGADLRTPPRKRLPRPGVLLPDVSVGALHIALSAVIEEASGAISYWALAHPAERPDFHHPDSFTLALP